MSESDNTTPYAASQYDEQIRRTLRHYDLFYEETIRLVEAVNPLTYGSIRVVAPVRS